MPVDESNAEIEKRTIRIAVATATPPPASDLLQDVIFYALGRIAGQPREEQARLIAREVRALADLDYPINGSCPFSGIPVHLCERCRRVDAKIRIFVTEARLATGQAEKSDGKGAGDAS